MKNILLLVHDDAGMEARFQAATDIARALEGHLSCVSVERPPVLVSDYYSAADAAMLAADEHQRCAANSARLTARLEHETIPWDWVEMVGPIGECIRDQAGLADLIIASGRLDLVPQGDMRAITGDILIKSGKPVVAMPESAGRFDVLGRAMIAWDGSAQAMAALRAAVPLLQLAEEVTLLEIDRGEIKAPAEEAARYLSRHGIEPLIRRERFYIGEVAAEIMRNAREWHIDYVVMGGYGHRRGAEALFGGVTRTMLTASQVPLFLAH